ncbi:hypothetical protein M422DRAFT_239842 [Sphaerobolus stellatus SS14]|nr:hypothetical protein M422DRAFT_239842 [Sphaerobolus stellatus SS14]
MGGENVGVGSSFSLLNRMLTRAPLLVGKHCRIYKDGYSEKDLVTQLVAAALGVFQSNNHILGRGGFLTLKDAIDNPRNHLLKLLPRLLSHHHHTRPRLRRFVEHLPIKPHESPCIYAGYSIREKKRRIMGIGELKPDLAGSRGVQGVIPMDAVPPEK